MEEENILYKHESYLIMGAAFEVYNHLGSGYLEGVYQEALAYEFQQRAIPFVEQMPLRIGYKTIQLNHIYRPDFVVYDKIIVELKAIQFLGPMEDSQVIHYLKATGLRLGLLLNFGHPKKLDYKRLAY